MALVLSPRSTSNLLPIDYVRAPKGALYFFVVAAYNTNMNDLSNPELVESHFDGREMDMFGLDVRRPEDREEWITTEPITREDPELVQQLLQRYLELHPVDET